MTKFNEMTDDQARRERARAYEDYRAGSFADRHPVLAIVGIVAFLAFGALSIFTALTLKAKIDGQVAQDRVMRSH